MNMKQALQVALMIVLGLAWSATAAFTPPTAEQLNAAATAPADNLAALLQGASADQAADVAGQLAELLAGMGLSADEQAGRLSQVIQVLFDSFPPLQHESLAAALGQVLAGSSAISDSALSSIREAVAAAAGTGDSSGTLLQTFDQAFTTSGGTLPPAPNPEPPKNEPPPPDEEPTGDDNPPSGSDSSGDDEPPPPPPPPPDYPGQNT